MKTSELIAKLQELQATHGDLDVRVYDEFRYCIPKYIEFLLSGAVYIDEDEPITDEFIGIM